MVGEHIRARRDGRWIHAIDCGDETVIQLAEDAPGPASVRRSYRPTFVQGAETVEVVTHRERTFPPVEVVARAYSRIADPTLAAMFRDSEAFAAWCATGRLPSGAPNVVAPGASAPPAEREPAPAAAKPNAKRARAAEPSAKRARAAKRARPKAKRTARAAAKRRLPKREKRRAAPAARKATKRAAKGKRSRRR
jgi:hypothetical protein